MLMSTIIGFLLSVVAFSTLVISDPGSVLTINSATVTNNVNDYLESWSAELTPTKKNTLLSATMTVKKQLPDTMQVKCVLEMEDQDPLEYFFNLCDAMDDLIVAKSFIEAGLPKDEFPKECPLGAGNWSVVKWDPPSDKIPPRFPDGRIIGKTFVMEDGKEPYVIIDFEGTLSHAIPGLGR